MSDRVLTWIVFLAFNVPIVALLAVAPWGRRLDEALREKSPDADRSGMTSAARVTAALGAAILTAFFWALGNIILAHALKDTSGATIQSLLAAVWPFFLAGSALFLPYAFNQLKAVMPTTERTNAELADLKARVDAIPTHYGADEVTRITIANLSSRISDADLRKVVDALTVQVKQHFAPEWKHGAKLIIEHPKLTGRLAPVHAAADAVIYIGDQHDDPKTGAQRAKGYHDRTTAGEAYGFVYLDVCELYQEPWSVTLSHEVLELLADPTAAMTVEDGRANGRSGARYALEVCDPTQGDHYDIDGVRVCNFVTRGFFGAPSPSGRMNHRGLPQTPFTPRPKGYIQFTDDLGTQQIWGADVTDTQKAARAELGEYRRNGRRRARVTH